MQETGEAIILCEGSALLGQCNYEQEGGLVCVRVCVQSKNFGGGESLFIIKF